MKCISILSASIMLSILPTFFNCSSSKDLQENAPIDIGLPYYQYWTAGIEGGGAGIDVFIPVKENLNERLVLDSIYFRNMASKLELADKTLNLFVGHLINNQNKQGDLILSSDAMEEYKNQLPKKPTKMPFEISENDCIISFLENGETKYFILKGLQERESEKFPGVPNNH